MRPRDYLQIAQHACVSSIGRRQSPKRGPRRIGGHGGARMPGRFLKKAFGLVVIGATIMASPIAMAASEMVVETTPMQERANDPKVRHQYGEWQVRCDTPQGAAGAQCVLMQFVTASHRENVGLSVILLVMTDGTNLMRVLAPLGVLIDEGLGLRIDGETIGRTKYVRCLPNGCVSEVALDDTLLARLATGDVATFVIFQIPTEGIGIPISLDGIREGMIHLGMLPEDGNLDAIRPAPSRSNLGEAMRLLLPPFF